jgi:hypothetical protein
MGEEKKVGFIVVGKARARTRFFGHAGLDSLECLAV